MAFLNQGAVLPLDPLRHRFPSLGSLVSQILPYIYVFAGLLLLVTLISGGVTLMTAAGDAGKTKAGYGKITAGLIGFLIIFVSFFAVQIVEVLLGVKIL
ncbi:MAG: hypothetical protein AAB574_03890 [Patescibacteria group bacterium]